MKIPLLNSRLRAMLFRTNERKSLGGGKRDFTMTTVIVNRDNRRVCIDRDSHSFVSSEGPRCRGAKNDLTPSTTRPSISIGM